MHALATLLATLLAPPPAAAPPPIPLLPAPLPMPREAAQEPWEVAYHAARWGVQADWVADQFRLSLAAKRFADSPAFDLLVPPASADAVREDARWRFRCWDALDDLVRMRRPDAIGRLERELGGEAFCFRRMPMPVSPAVADWLPGCPSWP